jgi:hypothetical protein
MEGEVRVVEIPEWIRCTQCKGYMRDFFGIGQGEVDRRGMICDSYATDNWLEQQQ